MAPGTPDYIEIQGGLAHTQQECLPMPPHTAWEWLEAYGALQAEPSKCFGAWDTAVAAVTAQLDEIMPESKLDEILARTKASIALKLAERFIAGSGWGALEAALRKQSIAPQLDFGEPGAEQQDWLMLLEKGAMDDLPPTSYMVQDEWFELLKKAEDPGWKILYHLALNYLRRRDAERANDCLGKALLLSENPWTLHAKAHFCRLEGKTEEAATLFARLLGMRPGDASLAKDALKALLAMQQYEIMLDAWSRLESDVQARPLVKFLHASALAHTGKLQEAEDIVMENGGLEVFDIREGEISTSNLYIFIQVEKAKLKGREIDPKSVAVPYALDLRMS